MPVACVAWLVEVDVAAVLDIAIVNYGYARGVSSLGNKVVA